MGLIAGAVILANILRRKIGWIRKGLMPVAVMAGFILLGVWLHNDRGWGVWIIWAGIILGLICAVSGFRNALRSMELMSKHKKDPEPPPVSFNDHD